jgi:hypothetical protein
VYGKTSALVLRGVGGIGQRLEKRTVLEEESLGNREVRTNHYLSEAATQRGVERGDRSVECVHRRNHEELVGKCELLLELFVIRLERQ